MKSIGTDCENIIYRNKHQLEFEDCLESIRGLNKSYKLYKDYELRGSPFAYCFFKQINTMKEKMGYKLGDKVTINFLTRNLDANYNLIETLNTVIF